MMTPEAEALVRSATVRAAVPFVPEVMLFTAAEPFALWDQTKRDAPPFWAFPWAGGQGLARYVLDHPETVAGRHVLDVASGSGLVAIAAAKAGAKTVIAGDIDENALAAITLNAAANHTPNVVARAVDLAASPGPGRQCTSGHHTGGHHTGGHDAGGRDGDNPGLAATEPATDLAAGVLRVPAVVLAADVFYQRELAALALAFLKAARRAGATVLAADPARAFVPKAELTALATYEIPVLQVLEDTAVKTVTIYRLP